MYGQCTECGAKYGTEDGVNFYEPCDHMKKELNHNEGKERWKPAGKPPEAKAGCWSREVEVMTNLRNTYQVSYFGDSKTGVWQRLSAFLPGEVVEFWRENKI